MLKKTIYSFMALSLTLMPMSEVFAADITAPPITADGTIKSGYTIEIDGTGTNVWTAGTITNEGGTLIVKYKPTYTTTPVPNYIQNSGNLVLDGGTLNLIGDTITGASLISAGEVDLFSNSKLQIGTGSGILSAVDLNLGESSTIDLKGNVGTDSNKYSLVLDNGDTWNGNINTNGAQGVLDLSGRTTAKGSKATYTQTTGTINLDNKSNLALNNASDYISGGDVKIGETSTGNTLNVQYDTSAKDSKGNKLESTLGKNANVFVYSGNTLSLTNKGTAVIDGDVNSGTEDDWNGTISVADNARLTLSKRNGDFADTTSATKKYNQTGGTLNLQDGSSLNLATNASSIKNGNVNIKGASKLALNNSTSNTAVVVTDGTESNGLTIGKGSTLNLKSGSVVDRNANVNVGGTLNIVDNSSVNLNNMASNGDYTTTSTDNATGDTWDGSINMSGGTLSLSAVEKYTDSDNGSAYNQTGGTLNLNDVSTLSLYGNTDMPNIISGGTVNIGSAYDEANPDLGNILSIQSGSGVTSDALVNIYDGNIVALTGNYGGNPSLVLDNSDKWRGIVYVGPNSGYLQLSGYDNSESDDRYSAIIQQTGGTLELVSNGEKSSHLDIANENSYISAGDVIIDTGNQLTISAKNTANEATLGENASVNLRTGGNLAVVGNGTAILNDIPYNETVAGSDEWNGNVTLGTGAKGESPVLTLKNVTKDFTNAEETGALLQNGGTLNIYANERGGSNITIYTKGNDKFGYTAGDVNIKGYDASKLSSLTMDVSESGTFTHTMSPQLQGNANLVYKMNGKDVTLVDVAPTGTGPNNTMIVRGNGKMTVSAPEKDLKMGYNLIVEDGQMTVDANSMTVGTTYKDEKGNTVKYGNLQIGKLGNKTETNFYTNALANNVYGDMSLHNAWYHMTNPKGKTTVNGNLYTGSGVDMMYGSLNSIKVEGTNTIDNLQLKIDVDPASGLADAINSSAVITNPNATIDLVDYNLLSTPRRDHYTFRVVNAVNENYTVGEGTTKLVSQKKITWTPLGGYQMIPSSVKGAFDMVLLFHNPQDFRGQVAVNTIYANQQVINNQLFDRMIYSNLPYFNKECSNKTASADTLFSPYQYSNNDTGLWFKPYANFEKIHMTYVGNVKNIAYGAMIGADFAKKQWGSWSFVPTAFIGYNGGHTSYNGFGLYSGSSMWHNGGQAGLMGTLTNKNFITMIAAYGGGYHNKMDFASYSDSNAMWNAGVASKTAYNIQLPWHFILQPTLYMAYNYVGASSFTGDYDGYMHKVKPLNAFSIAPGASLIWQRETFSIYGLFQAMFNIGATAGGRIAEMDLPSVGIRDPYFEYGVGVSKFFKDRFSGYGQVVGRSGSRKGIGFQLGMNLKL